jgi:hypothetical protein
MSLGPDDYDSPWKEAIESFLPACLELLYPRAFAEIDWTKPPTFLDQELRQVQREAELGRSVVDRLIQVYRTDGSDSWVLIHVEVQSQPDTAFAKRMFTYYYRLVDRFDRPIASLAILGDERKRWRPNHYRRDLWGSGVQFRFRSVKLHDYRERLAELEANRNPFATIILAHLRTQDTRHDMPARMGAKLAVLRRLYRFDYNREQILRLYHTIDWMMALPPALERQFVQEVIALEEAAKMPYVTSAERVGREIGREIGREEGLKEGLLKGREAGREAGREEGREEGRREGVLEGLLMGIEAVLNARFGAASHEVLPDIRRLTDVAVVRAIQTRALSASSLEEIRQLYR